MAEAQFLFVPPTEPTKIGVIEVDVMVESEFNLESEVSEYPVEDGFTISDNVTQKQLKLSLTVMISPMPVTWYENFKETAQDRVFNAVDELYWIWQRREPITIVTKLNVWENMVMISCPIRRSKEDGIALKAAIDFVQIIKVDTKTEQIPAEYVDLLTKPKAQASNTDAGTAETSQISSDNSNSNDGVEPTTAKRQSIAAGIFGGA